MTIVRQLQSRHSGYTARTARAWIQAAVLCVGAVTLARLPIAHAQAASTANFFGLDGVQGTSWAPNYAQIKLKELYAEHVSDTLKFGSLAVPALDSTHRITGYTVLTPAGPRISSVHVSRGCSVHKSPDITGLSAAGEPVSGLAHVGYVRGRCNPLDTSLNCPIAVVAGVYSDGELKAFTIDTGNVLWRKSLRTGSAGVALAEVMGAGDAAVAVHATSSTQVAVQATAVNNGQSLWQCFSRGESITEHGWVSFASGIAAELSSGCDMGPWLHRHMVENVVNYSSNSSVMRVELAIQEAKYAAIMRNFPAEIQSDWLFTADAGLASSQFFAVRNGTSGLGGTCVLGVNTSNAQLLDGNLQQPGLASWILPGKPADLNEITQLTAEAAELRAVEKPTLTFPAPLSGLARWDATWGLLGFVTSPLTSSAVPGIMPAGGLWLMDTTGGVAPGLLNARHVWAEPGDSIISPPVILNKGPLLAHLTQGLPATAEEEQDADADPAWDRVRRRVCGFSLPSDCQDGYQDWDSAGGEPTMPKATLALAFYTSKSALVVLHVNVNLSALAAAHLRQQPDPESKLPQPAWMQRNNSCLSPLAHMPPIHANFSVGSLVYRVVLPAKPSGEPMLVGGYLLVVTEFSQMLLYTGGGALRELYPIPDQTEETMKLLSASALPAFAGAALTQVDGDVQVVVGACVLYVPPEIVVVLAAGGLLLLGVLVLTAIKYLQGPPLRALYHCTPFFLQLWMIALRKKLLRLDKQVQRVMYSPVRCLVRTYHLMVLRGLWAQHSASPFPSMLSPTVPGLEMPELRTASGGQFPHHLSERAIHLALPSLQPMSHAAEPSQLRSTAGHLHTTVQSSADAPASMDVGASAALSDAATRHAGGTGLSVRAPPVPVSGTHSASGGMELARAPSSSSGTGSEGSAEDDAEGGLDETPLVDAGAAAGGSLCSPRSAPASRGHRSTASATLPSDFMSVPTPEVPPADRLIDTSARRRQPRRGSR